MSNNQAVPEGTTRNDCHRLAEMLMACKVRMAIYVHDPRVGERAQQIGERMERLKCPLSCMDKPIHQALVLLNHDVARLEAWASDPTRQWPQ